MEAPILERIRGGLLEKQNGLTEWLRLTSSQAKDVMLGPSTEQAVHAHIGAIENSIARAESGTLGRCKVCHDYVEPDLLEMDYTACVCIEHLSEEEVHHLESELELAQSVQKSLLPDKVPETPGLDIAAFSRPAQIVGGDYFDFVRFEDGTQGLAIADVAGHGVSASLHMASIQALLRSTVPASRSPAEVVAQMHRLFIHNIRFTTFVTFFLGAFDPTTKTFTYCNAGHNPPLVLRNHRSGGLSRIWLNPTGPALGLVEEPEFGERTLNLQDGDLFTMYTDGITEAMNRHDETFGSERLAVLLERISSSTPKEVVRGIREGLEGFTEDRPLADDTTVVVGRISAQT
jgi:sigma-B regulation protein RsbU (phosphoserine phosphatase)